MRKTGGSMWSRFISNIHYNVLITYFVFIIFPLPFLPSINSLPLSLPHLPACDDLQTYRMRVLYCLMIEVRSPALVGVCNSISVSENKSYWFCFLFLDFFFHQRKNCCSLNWIHSHSHSQFKDSSIVWNRMILEGWLVWISYLNDIFRLIRSLLK